MRFLFEIVFPLKPTLHIFIFKYFNSLKVEGMYIFKLTVSLLYLIIKVDLHDLVIKTYSVNRHNKL